MLTKYQNKAYAPPCGHQCRCREWALLHPLSDDPLGSLDLEQTDIWTAPLEHQLYPGLSRLSDDGRQVTRIGGLVIFACGFAEVTLYRPRPGTWATRSTLSCYGSP